MDNFFDFSNPAFCNVTPGEKAIRKDDCDDMVLAMAYVPVQQLKNTYDAESGLCEGTIFPELNKPFVGCKKGWVNVG